MLRLLLRIVSLVEIGLEMLGVLFTAMIGVVVLGYLAVLVAGRWPATGVLLGFVAIIVWFVFVGAFSRLYVSARRAK